MIYAVIEEHSLSSSDYKYYNKLENAKLDAERYFNLQDRLMMEKCYSQFTAYTDVLCLIESSGVLE